MPLLPSIFCSKCCAPKLKHKLKISTNEVLPHCINFSPEIIRVTLFVFTRPFVHIYFIIYHIRGAHIYLLLLGCFNPFAATVRFVPEQFTLNIGIFCSIKKKSVLVHLSHCCRNSDPFSQVTTKETVSQLQFLSVLIRAMPQALVNKRLQELLDFDKVI